MRQTKSDWFLVANLGQDKFYMMEIFGVNKYKGTKHCIRILQNNEEIEVFHFQDLRQIIKEYNLDYFKLSPHSINQPWIKMTKENINKYSKQLQEEGVGVIREGTKNLINLVRRRNANAI